MKQLILVRHGLTANNAAGVIQGTLDTPLNELGHRQAAALANALSLETIDLIVSSPQQRAFRTAVAVADCHKLPISTDEKLRERSFGVYEGGPRQGYRDARLASGLLRFDFKPDGGETLNDVWARCAMFLDALKCSPAESPLVVAHEAVNRCLILMILGLMRSEWAAIKQDNCAINKFRFHEDGSLDQHELNGTFHLQAIF